MLSIVNAAETQFRFESETRTREHALLASIRERRAAETVHPAVSAEPRRSAFSPRPAQRGARAEWPRPIGIKNCAETACAIA